MNFLKKDHSIIIPIHSEALVVGGKNFPATLGHEAWGKGFVVLGHSSHAGTRDKVEVLLDAAGTTEEFHLLVDLVVGGDLEGKHIDTVEHSLLVNEELLTVPGIVQVLVGDLGVLNTGGVSTSDEVSQTAADSG